MRLLIMGPQGVGKGTQAALLAEHYGIPAISTGDIFRYNIKNKTELGLEALKYTDKGELVPDELTNKIVKDRLSMDDAKNGWILDGYPRNASQVKALDAMLEELGTPLDKVVALDADHDVLMQRIAKRAQEQGRSDDTPEAITLSSFDPVRREVARIALERLISDGRIHPARIEEMVEKARREVDATIKQEGERAIIEAGVNGIHPELVKLLGRLRYRTSYGQNVLNHSLEVAYLSGMIASELGLDPTIARRAGLLHDIGKALDHEIEGSHVDIGVDVARRYKEGEAVVHAIHAHHGDVEAKTVIACIVQAADAISAARPGARRENLENYIKRLEKLEEVASSFDGVSSCYAIQAGREIRIMVKPEVVNDERMVLLAREICKKIEDDLDYPGQSRAI